MQPSRPRRYALADYMVEHRARVWYFGRPFHSPKSYAGPDATLASVTLMIARQLRKEVERRDASNGAD